MAAGVGLGGDVFGDRDAGRELGFIGGEPARGDQCAQHVVGGGAEEVASDLIAGHLGEDAAGPQDLPVRAAAQSLRGVEDDRGCKPHERRRRHAAHTEAMEEVDRRKFHAVALDVVNQVGAPAPGLASEGVLNLQYTGFDCGEIQTGAAEEGHHAGPHALDGHLRRGDSARHLSDDVGESHAVRRGEAAITEPFGIDRRKDRQQAGGHDLRRQQTGVVEEHGTRTLRRSHDRHRAPDGSERFAHFRMIQQSQWRAARAG